MQQKALAWLLTIILLLGLPGLARAADGPYPLNCVPSPEAGLKSRLLAREAKTLRSLQPPAAVDYTALLPEPGDQGRQGSCVAWAVAYAYKSYQENLERQWGLNSAGHLFSPAFIYNQINGGRDNGATFYDALQLISQQGCDTLQGFPYREYDYLSRPGPAQLQRAYHFRSKSWWTIDYNPDGGIDPQRVKQALQQGPVLAGTLVFWEAGWSKYYGSQEGVISLADINWQLPHDLTGGHAICLVGYDDNYPTKDGNGAFKFINSWGKDWGRQGYGWMSYAYLANAVFEAHAMEDLTGTLQLSQAALTLSPGQRAALTARADYSDGTVEDITGQAVWASLNEGVARVQGGQVEAVAPGRAVITADYGFKQVTCEITVQDGRHIPVQGLTLDRQELLLPLNSQVRLTAVIEPAEASNPAVSWASSNPAVVAVDKNGLLKARRTGTAVITATSADGGFTAQCTVEVARLKKLTADSTYIKGLPGQSAGLTLLADFGGGRLVDVTQQARWRSNRSKVVTVNAGELQLVAPGSTTVTAGYGGRSITIRVKVEKP
ncbi:Ig-like domain-containing protein [Desulforamulus hydrothermalis]|uniref:Uncharacterized protein n=1 Tax=Desulforamulus hydrothermalis Lam5 = DSM 18033 TaxID=1121428 RepID=K8DXZ6_9FIRM|nr:Ig-like domain-containing protein [Desulforamulus hydrothermalis]CCO07632.1 exported hypothetical protein [Desulforamulus hydrothermalis Lam5 = DSM 18033]SHH19486.1 Ig-like domain (group 2) [Desulforamulus hydrothermalis Lam5 = DSM 18033]